MAQKYISDGKVILNLQGLRWVSKETIIYDRSNERYYLKWNYKGSDASMQYERKEDRDAIYLRLCEALTGQ